MTKELNTWKRQLKHLLHCLQEQYKLLINWNGALNCRIKLQLNYAEHHLDTLMPGFIVKMLQKFKHDAPTQLLDALYLAVPWSHSKAAHKPWTQDDTPTLSPNGIKCIQQSVGSIWYYSQANNHTILMALSTIAKEKPHSKTWQMGPNF